jgi:hypothetical protein
MRLIELFEPRNIFELNPDPSKSSAANVSIEKSGNWEFRTSNSPRKVSNSDNRVMYLTRAVFNGSKSPFKPNEPQYITGLGMTQSGSLDDAKEKIRQLGQRTVNFDLYKSFTIDLNVDFTNEYLKDKIAFFKFSSYQGIPVLIMADAEYYNQYKDVMDEKGFRSAKPRTIPENGSTLYAFPTSRREIKDNGLLPGGRYALHPEGLDDDGNEMFSMIYDSTANGPQDKYRMKVPGLTVAGNLIRK